MINSCNTDNKSNSEQGELERIYLVLIFRGYLLFLRSSILSLLLNAYR